jgi:hypothetical protein
MLAVMVDLAKGMSVNRSKIGPAFFLALASWCANLGGVRILDVLFSSPVHGRERKTIVKSPWKGPGWPDSAVTARIEPTQA